MRSYSAVEEASNRQNDRILSTSASAILEEHKFVQRVQKPSSVMVWGGVSAIGRTPLVFIPMGVKINAVTYQNLVLEPVVKDLGVNMFGNQPFLFQQDGAPAHTANSTQEWLRIEIPDFIAKEEWPPSSPDVNPLRLLCLVHIGDKTYGIPIAYLKVIQLFSKPFYPRINFLKFLDGDGEGCHYWLFRNGNTTAQILTELLISLWSGETLCTELAPERHSLSDKPRSGRPDSLPRLEKWRVRSGVEFGETPADQWGKWH